MIEEGLKKVLTEKWQRFFPFAMIIACGVIFVGGGFFLFCMGIAHLIEKAFLLAFVCLIAMSVCVGLGFMMWQLIKQAAEYYEMVDEKARRKLREQMYTESAIIKKNRDDFEKGF